MGGAAGAAGGAWAICGRGCAKAALTSRSMIRPWGPLPRIAERSRPESFAMRRAKGDAKIRGPTWPLTGPPGTAASSAVAPAGASARATGDGVAAFGEAARAAAETSSPSPAMTPMTSFTATSAVPSGTTILASTPSSIASTSIVALSVSISARMSPDLTLSPSFFSHRLRLPFSMVGESAGIRMLIGMGGSHFERKAEFDF